MLRLALALALGQVGFHAFIASLPIALVAAGKPDATIGTIMGAASVVPMVAALFAGGLNDRFGGGRVFLLGAGAFLAAAAVFAVGLVGASSPVVALLAVRALQGFGLAAVLPAAFSLVAERTEPRRVGTALGLVGVGANISLAISPPLSLAVLDASSLQAVAAMAAVAVIAATVLVFPLRARRPPSRPPGGATRSLLRPSWDGRWLAPLAVTLLFIAHWGVVTGYLSQRAELAGADVGFFFTADALGVLALRVPAGLLADRVGSAWLVRGGLLVTMCSLALLLPPPTTPLLMVAGLGTGMGAAMIMPPIALELTHRSEEHNRGSAFAFYNVAFSGGVTLGSIGVAPLIGVAGFELALAIGIAACAIALFVALLGGSFGRAIEPAPGTGLAGQV